MINKKTKRTDMAAEHGTSRRTIVLARGIKQCCPFLNRVRYYKTQDLKDEKVFYYLTGANMDSKQSTADEREEKLSTSTMFYL